MEATSKRNQLYSFNVDFTFNQLNEKEASICPIKLSGGLTTSSYHEFSSTNNSPIIRTVEKLHELYPHTRIFITYGQTTYASELRYDKQTLSFISKHLPVKFVDFENLHEIQDNAGILIVYGSNKQPEIDAIVAQEKLSNSLISVLSGNAASQLLANNPLFVQFLSKSENLPAFPEALLVNISAPIDKQMKNIPESNQGYAITSSQQDSNEAIRIKSRNELKNFFRKAAKEFNPKKSSPLYIVQTLKNLSEKELTSPPLTGRALCLIEFNKKSQKVVTHILDSNWHFPGLSYQNDKSFMQATLLNSKPSIKPISKEDQTIVETQLQTLFQSLLKKMNSNSIEKQLDEFLETGSPHNRNHLINSHQFYIPKVFGNEIQNNYFKGSVYQTHLALQCLETFYRLDKLLKDPYLSELDESFFYPASNIPSVIQKNVQNHSIISFNKSNFKKDYCKLLENAFTLIDHMNESDLKLEFNALFTIIRIQVLMMDIERISSKEKNIDFLSEAVMGKLKPDIINALSMIADHNLYKTGMGFKNIQNLESRLGTFPFYETTKKLINNNQKDKLEWINKDFPDSTRFVNSVISINEFADAIWFWKEIMLNPGIEASLLIKALIMILKTSSTLDSSILHLKFVRPLLVKTFELTQKESIKDSVIWEELCALNYIFTQELISNLADITKPDEVVQNICAAQIALDDTISKMVYFKENAIFTRKLKISVYNLIASIKRKLKNTEKCREYIYLALTLLEKENEANGHFAEWLRLYPDLEINQRQISLIEDEKESLAELKNSIIVNKITNYCEFDLIEHFLFAQFIKDVEEKKKILYQLFECFTLFYIAKKDKFNSLKYLFKLKNFNDNSLNKVIQKLAAAYRQKFPSKQ